MSSWRNKFVSLGWCVVLLNLFLNSICVFFLSFMNMSVLVWKKLVDLHRFFLWWGHKGGVKFAWVKWEDVCKSKRTRGLGVKDLRIDNMPYWVSGNGRFFQTFLFFGVISIRQCMCFGYPLGGRVWGLRTVSHWWKGISHLGIQPNQELNWSIFSCLKRVGMVKWLDFYMMSRKVLPLCVFYWTCYFTHKRIVCFKKTLFWKTFGIKIRFWKHFENCFKIKLRKFNS